MDFATSDNAAVQAQLDRLAALSVPDGRLGLDTIRALLDRLGNPHRSLPPVFHVAGTNGKGSTCAFLRAMMEADGKRVHVTTSPHLVRYNERIRLAGTLIEDEALAALLEEVLDASSQGGDDLNPSFFEVTIAAAFLAFSRTPADACIVEVGLGGRFDATNVLGPDVLSVCGIAALGIDHEKFLLAPEDGVPEDPMARIAFEKAGIAKPGVPLVTLDYPVGPTKALIDQAMAAGAPLALRGLDWTFRDGAMFSVSIGGTELTLPKPSLPGAHQTDNASLAVAMTLAQSAVAVGPMAMSRGLRSARWPARMQRLANGPLTGSREVWLDGGHNLSAGKAIARHFEGKRLHLVLGMLANKPPRALLDPLAGTLLSVTAIPVPGHEYHPAHSFGENVACAADAAAALAAIPDDGHPVLIAGSLYLAGEILRLNEEWPD